MNLLASIGLFFTQTHKTYCVRCKQNRVVRTIDHVDIQKKSGKTMCKRVVGKCPICRAKTSTFVRAG